MTQSDALIDWLTELRFLANVNVNVNVRYLLSPVCPSVCLSVCLYTFVRPTQAVQIFGNISTALGTLAMSKELSLKNCLAG